MPTKPLPATTPLDSGLYSIPASQYSFQQLAEIYNQSRVDYIVPMPMNARRMEEYVHHYDVKLDASIVVLTHNREVAGIGMLGVRGERGWITRLGVIPEKRGRHLGLFMMQSLVDQARARNILQLQLEVIKGNAPAHNLFTRLGFTETRELMVVRRPPAPMDTPLPDSFVIPLDEREAAGLLYERDPGASWVDETDSLLHAGHLFGLSIKLENGESGWVVYRSTSFQLSHIVIKTPDSPMYEAIALALLGNLHKRHPTQDTKLENLPTLSPLWPIFQQVGYRETFSRIEMVMPLV